MSGREQCAAFCDLVKTNKEDVDDESDEQQGHNLSESLSESLLNTCCNCVLSIVGVDNAGCEVEAVLQSGKDRTEVAGQSAGTDVEDQHSNDCLKSTGKCVVPFLSHQAIAYQGKEADHVRSFLQNVGCKKVPNRAKNLHYFFLLILFLFMNDPRTDDSMDSSC